MIKQDIKRLLDESQALHQALREDDAIISAIQKLVTMIIVCLKNGGKVILFGNGGSASDSQHIAAEFVGRFKYNRKAFAALALTGDTCNLTCIGNDFGFEHIFSRQIEALACAKDIAIGISTSATSPNVIAGITQAKRMGLRTAVLAGAKKTALTRLADVTVSVPSTVTARIQEAHITIGHITCELVEKAIGSDKR
ncbi:MAG: SIS domain-containing protein [Candidatus Omnitrophota bacterium]